MSDLKFAMFFAEVEFEREGFGVCGERKERERGEREGERERQREIFLEERTPSNER